MGQACETTKWTKEKATPTVNKAQSRIVILSAVVALTAERMIDGAPGHLRSTTYARYYYYHYYCTYEYANLREG